MANLILHSNGAYNIYSTVDLTPCYERALTLNQLREALFLVFSDAEMADLPAHLERTHRTGCSIDIDDMTLEGCIQGNRAGRKGAELSLADFSAKYLTLTS